MEQRYVIDESVQHGYVGSRDARTFLPFLLPHLRSGMDVLDAGCGVGSIALDLAPMIAPGRVTGIDPDAGQIDAARRSASERGIENAEFQTGSVNELPFAEESFDVVYANAVLIYVRDPIRALAEFRRVLRPDGLAPSPTTTSARSSSPRTYPRCASQHSSSSARWCTRVGIPATPIIFED
jgi:ubiquinone/menaquinone biosynthesis C-methylase UbiE